MKYAINVIVTTYTVIVITVRLGLENGGGIRCCLQSAIGLEFQQRAGATQSRRVNEGTQKKQNKVRKGTRKKREREKGIRRVSCSPHGQKGTGVTAIRAQPYDFNTTG